MYWYIFKTEGNDVSDQNQYTRVESVPAPCDGKKNHLHAIFTHDDEGKPVLNDMDLMNDIVNALRNKKDSSNVLLRATQ
ncbi:hypothetical protein ACR780_09165 [Sphingobacterium faecium]|uniref:hypothetical protein n=1 Tax=Sphingobacterium faecium TaxID=34087 RepID=UPI003DA35517